MFQAPMAPCLVYCPRAISRKNRGNPINITQNKYGNKKAPGKRDRLVRETEISIDISPAISMSDAYKTLD